MAGRVKMTTSIAAAPGSGYPALYLKKGEHARLRAGHVWVFSNEVDVQRTPLTEFPTGEPVVVLEHGGRPLGLGYVNPKALICVRLLTRGLERALDRSLIVHRLNVALSLRQRLYAQPFYRLVYGESDGLPGLVLDRFGSVVVGQIATAGMEKLKTEVAAAIEQVLQPDCLVWKNAGSARSLEGLPAYTEIAFGSLPESLLIEEGGLRFAIDVLGGQKTGWFFDQRANRDLLAPFVRDARVLDLFSYVGAWGLRAAAFAAREVVCVDTSAAAVAAIGANAARNGLANRVQAVQSDAFDFLRQARKEQQRFEVVVVDPPAFAKRKKDLTEARLAYRRINEAAMQVLVRDGILVTCSCSYHLPRAVLLDVLQRGAQHLDRRLQVLIQLQQAADHPILPAIAETEYLKGFITRVLPSQ